MFLSLKLYLDEGGFMLWRRYDSSDDDLVVEFTHVRVGLEELLLRLQIMSFKNFQITAQKRGGALCTATHHKTIDYAIFGHVTMLTGAVHL